MLMNRTFLMFSSLCFKQSVNTTFLTPDFSRIFRVLCSGNAISLSDVYPTCKIPLKKHKTSHLFVGQIGKVHFVKNEQMWSYM